MKKFRIGVIADDAVGISMIRVALNDNLACEVVEQLQAAQVTLEKLNSSNIDLWIAELSSDDSDDCIDLLYDADNHKPVFVGEGVPKDHGNHYDVWRNRLYNKIQEWKQTVDEEERQRKRKEARLASQSQEVDSQESEKNIQTASQHAANDVPPIEIKNVAHSIQSEKKVSIDISHITGTHRAINDDFEEPVSTAGEYVWVLGASVGGPNAVKQFLDALPDGLPVAFIYAQHTIDGQSDHLCKVLSRHNNLEIIPFRRNKGIKPGQVIVVPTEHKISIPKAGVMKTNVIPWEGDYSPNISAVITEVAKVYRGNSGAIIFSGMGDDAATGTAVMRHYGGEVWVQTAESCVCDAMPEAVVQSVDISFSGTPEELAAQLAKKYQRTSINQEAV